MFRAMVLKRVLGEVQRLENAMKKRSGGREVGNLPDSFISLRKSDGDGFVTILWQGPKKAIAG